MRIATVTPTVVTVTATVHELTVLVAGARMALEAVTADTDAPAAVGEHLAAVVRNFDSAVAALSTSTTLTEGN